MLSAPVHIRRLSLILLLALIVSCNNPTDEIVATVVVPTRTPLSLPTTGATPVTVDRDFIVIATDAPNPNFTDFDKFGSVIGFNNDLMARISAIADFDYEFVVTPHEGVLESIATQSNRDFDAVMSALVIPDVPEDGIAYSVPYLETGQVLVVLADESDIQSYRDVRPDNLIGVEANSSAEQAAEEVLALTEDELVTFASPVESLQALVDGLVDGAIIDSHTATHFVQTYPEQLKIAGGLGRDAWISSKAYGIAVAADNRELLDRLNQAIVEAQNDLTIERLTVAWLISEGNFNAGESRVPTPASELIIGIVGQLLSLDPASDPDLISWEVKYNTMSGLFEVDSNSNLVPMLAEDAPTISEDKLEYTFRLRQGLRFPDGSELTAEDVKWAIDRSAALGSFLVNDFLKDSNDDNFADDDAVQVMDAYTVMIRLQEPTSFLLSLLATPPFFPISSDCLAEIWDLTNPCGGIGPYTIVDWDADGIRLKANPEWPGSPAPAFENIHVRFFEEPARMLRSMLEFQSIDVAWTGLPYADFLALQSTDLDADGTIDFTGWEGPAIFKSYLIFEQDTPPWNSKNVRQAVSYAVDRNALASIVFNGSRKPLFSPVPDQLPGHVPVLPVRSLDRAQALLLAEGYSPDNPLEITIWYTDDAHYTPLEAAYANAIKSQLEETDVFRVTLASAPWELFRPNVSQCNYPAYLLGWPTPGQPASYPDVTSWTDFFVQNTGAGSGFCSNYESETMTELVTAAREETDREARFDLYAQIQQLWADELPTLDLTQEPRQAISLDNVANLRIDAMGMMHYEVLTKGGG